MAQETRNRALDVERQHGRPAPDEVDLGTEAPDRTYLLLEALTTALAGACGRPYPDGV